MGAIAGYLATVSLSGSSTAMVEEPCTQVSYVGTVGVHQITAPTKRVLDPAVPVTVFLVGGEAPANEYTVDYLFGTITFLAGIAMDGDPVAVSANFLPIVQVAECRSASVAAERTELDTSVLGTVEKSLILGKRGATVEMESLHLLSEDLDSGGGTLVVDTIFDNATPKLVQVYDGTARYFRGWCTLPITQQAIPADELITSSLTWRSSFIRATGRNEVVSFAWGT